MHRFRKTALALSLALSLALAAAPALATTYTWTSGNFVAGTTAPSPLLAGDVLSIEGAGGKSFNAVSFSNQGLVNWLAGNPVFSEGAVVNNLGVWEAQGNGTLLHGSGSAAAFNNSGTLRKSAGTGTTTIGNDSNFQFTNSGAIEVATGTLQFSGDSRFLAGTSFSGAGSAVVSAASSFSGAFSSSNLTLQAASSTLQTGNDAVIAGQVNWVGSGLAGQWTVGAGATLLASGSSATGNKLITGAATVLTNAGSLVLDSATGIGLADGAMLVNQGSIDIRVNQGFTQGGGGAATFSNHGLLRKSGGIGSSGFGAGLVFVNDGTIDVQTGTLQFSGSNTFNAGTVFSGAGRAVVSTPSTFSGAFRSESLSIASTASQAITGQDAQLSGSVDWSGGRLEGRWTIAADGQLTGSGTSATGNKRIGGADTVITVFGGLVLNSFTSISLADGARIVNHGLIDLQSNAGLLYSSGAGVSLVNHGVLRKTVGTGSTTVGGNEAANFTLVNLGRIEVHTGTLRLTDGFVNDGTLAGVATLQVSGGLTNKGTLAPGLEGAGTLTLTGGTVTLDPASVFSVDLTSLASHDQLLVTGTALLGGTLALNCVADCSFAVGDMLTVLDASSAIVGSFAQVTLQGFASGAFEVIYDQPSDSVRLLVTQAVSAVPEPRALTLLLAGLMAVGFVARRRVAP